MTTPNSTPSTEATQLQLELGRLDAVVGRVDGLLRRFSLPLLRISLGAIFVWFGALKVVGGSPAHDLVANTLPWIEPGFLVAALGWFEIAIGVMLITGFLLGWVCAVMVGHLCGTFLAVVMQPEVMFQHGNPLMLTMEGEFVAKNLVLIMSALVIGVWARQGARLQRAARPGI